jgi:hypothetical protein
MPSIGCLDLSDLGNSSDWEKMINNKNNNNINLKTAQNSINTFTNANACMVRNNQFQNEVIDNQWASSPDQYSYKTMYESPQMSKERRGLFDAYTTGFGISNLQGQNQQGQGSQPSQQIVQQPRHRHQQQRQQAQQPSTDIVPINPYMQTAINNEYTGPGANPSNVRPLLANLQWEPEILPEDPQIQLYSIYQPQQQIARIPNYMGQDQGLLHAQSFTQPSYNMMKPYIQVKENFEQIGDLISSTDRDILLLFIILLVFAIILISQMTELFKILYKVI